MTLPAFTSPEAHLMRRSMGRFTTGVAVVTTMHGGDQHGMTINSLTSISLEPPILLISLMPDARTTECVEASGRFAVSILNSRQEAVARHFAKQGRERFADIDYDISDAGVPIVRGALVQADCRVIESSTMGDHRVHFGQVEGIREGEGTALAFHGGRFGSFTGDDTDELVWIF